VPDADVGEAGRVVSANWNVPCDVGHVVVHARVPAQRKLRDHVSESGHRVADAVGAHEWEGAKWSRQCARQRPRQAGAGAAIHSDNAHGRLAAQNRRCKYIGGNEQSEVPAGIEVRAQVCGQIQRDFPDLELARERDVAAGGDGRVIIDGRERPSRLLGGCREAPEESGYPEAHAAFVGGCDRRRAHKSAERRDDMPAT
jgi:hypothetical protein